MGAQPVRRFNGGAGVVDARRYVREDGAIVMERDVAVTNVRTDRKVWKPKQVQVGTQLVPTVETVEVKNPSTMKMSTEYMEPYIKRDGYQQDRIPMAQKETRIVRKGSQTLSASRQQTVAPRAVTFSPRVVVPNLSVQPSMPPMT